MRDEEEEEEEVSRRAVWEEFGKFINSTATFR